jgi:hypothetical protein
MSKSAKDRLAALERQQEEVIELEHLSEVYKDIFGETSPEYLNYKAMIEDEERQLTKLLKQGKIKL